MTHQSKTLHIIYHSADVDGFTSGFLMDYFLRNKLVDFGYYIPDTINLIPFNYGFYFNVKKIKKGDMIFMGDISLPPEIMKQLISVADIWWFDHHVTAIEEYTSNDIIKHLNGEWSVNVKCGCEHFWSWAKALLSQDAIPEEKIEGIDLFVKIVGDFDTWRANKTDIWDELVSMQYALKGMQLDISKPKPMFWNQFIDNCDNIDCFLQQIFDIGNIVYPPFKKNYYEESKSYGGIVDFEGLSVMIVNRPSMNGSISFDTILKEVECDIVCNFVYSVKRRGWGFHFYSGNKKINFNEVFAKYDWKGHAQAGCIRCKSWEIDDNNLVLHI